MLSVQLGAGFAGRLMRQIGAPGTVLFRWGVEVDLPPGGPFARGWAANLAIALIFGFGVDYGIYMMQSEAEDDAGSLRSVGGTVALCSLTTVASCGSLMTSFFEIVR